MVKTRTGIMKKIHTFTIFSIISIFSLIQPVYSAESDIHSPVNGKTILWKESPNFLKESNEFTLEKNFPDVQWWNQFNDPLMNKYIQRALSNNQDIKIALARIEEANSTVKITFAKELPTLSIAGIYARLKNSDNFLFPNVPQGESQSPLTGAPSNIYILPLSAKYELDLFGKNHTKTKSSKKQADMTKFDHKTVLISISSSVAAAYFNLIQTDKLLNLQNELLKVTKEIELQTGYLYKEGLYSYDDVLTAQQNVSIVKTNISELKKLQSALVHQLCILMGVPPIEQSAFERNTIDDIALSLRIPAGIPSELITHRPDILAAEAALEKAGLDVSFARKDFLPSLNTRGIFGYASSEADKWFDWSSILASVVASISQSIYTGGEKTAKLKYQKAIYKESLQNYHKVILTSFKEVEDSLSSITSDITKYKQAQEDVVASQQKYHLTDERYKEGINSYLDILLSNQQLLNYKQSETQQKGSLLVDNISLFKALGGGF